jgi:hypothetical protein
MYKKYAALIALVIVIIAAGLVIYPAISTTIAQLQPLYTLLGI